jgi:hypothetical protein
MSNSLPDLSQSGGLPNSSVVNVSALSRLFERNTTSYKFLFFLSILDVLERNDFNIEVVDFQSLTLEMLVNAWVPCIIFHLSLGSQDKISRIIDSLKLNFDESLKDPKLADKVLIRRMITNKDLSEAVNHLRKNVPFRLIIPFLEDCLGDVNRGKGTELEMAMPAIANQFFESHKPLYKFNSTHYRDCDLVLIHPDWIDYLRENFKVVRRWTEWEWASYMQNRNPSVPNIAAKLF